jgi:fluoride ion exporter CrcB/FEX
MLQRLRNHTVAITIGVSFFVFGFFVMSNLLQLTDREILIGLVAGGIGGLTTLVSMLWQDRRDNPTARAVEAA